MAKLKVIQVKSGIGRPKRQRDTLRGLGLTKMHQERILDEANPLWNTLILENPALFIVAKLSIAGLGCRLLYKFREKPAAKAGILLCFLVYYALLCCFYYFVFH